MGKLAPSILITRTEPGAKASAMRLTQAGYTAITSPVLQVQSSAHPAPDLDGVQCVIATSAHGVIFFAALPGADAVPLYCFAGASLEAALAGSIGDNVHTITANAEELTAMVQKERFPKGGAVLWVRGRHYAFDVKAALVTQGFAVREWEAYEAMAADALNPETKEAFRKGSIKAVLFHSARGAKVFLTLAQQENLPLGEIKAITISGEAAKPLGLAGFNAIHVAENPSEAAIMDAVSAHIPLS